MPPLNPRGSGAVLARALDVRIKDLFDEEPPGPAAPKDEARTA